MPDKRVEVRRTLKGDATNYWERLVEFDISWHPNVQHCQIVANDQGAIDRIFQDENGQQYQERLSYLSQTEGTIRYHMIKGIDSAQKYEAEINLTQDKDQTEITWSAQVTSDIQNLEQICAGTEAIFMNAIDEIKYFSPPKLQSDHQVSIDHFIIEGSPRITGLATTPNPCKPLTIFLHGIGGNASNWQPQLEELGVDYPSIALNLRGYGDAELGISQTQLFDYFTDIIRTAEFWGHKKFILVGLSYGAWIATAFAQAYPSKLHALILAGGCTGMSEADPAEREAFMSARLEPLNNGLEPKDFAQKVVDIIAGPNATNTQRNELFNSMSAISSETYRDALYCFCNPTEKHNFSQITAPTFLITGEHDSLASPAEIKAVAHRMRDKRSENAGPVCFEIVQGAGHLCNIEAPRTFNQYLRNAFKLISQTHT